MNTNLHPQLQKCHDKFNLQNNSPLFDYSETIYENVKTNIIIKCLKCNTYFEQLIGNHLNEHKGNCKCKQLKINTLVEDRKIIELNNIQKQKNTTIELSVNTHGNLYNYDKIVLKLVNSCKWIYNIKCNRCNTIFNQRSHDHLKGSGCKKCNCHNFHNINTYRNKPTILYYVKINNMFKIGLSMSSVKKRYIRENNNPLIDKIDIIKTWNFDDGAIAYKLEKEIIDTYSELKYDYKKYGRILNHGGNSELFIENIFEEIAQMIEPLYD